jgi:ribosomal protein S12 methylthiotransferase
MKSFHITTLGCAKNQVDSDFLIGMLNRSSFHMTDEPEKADVLIVNTCGFIESAKEESLQAIYEALDLKKSDPEKKVIAIGCLSKRYQAALSSEIPELDGIFGTEAYDAITSQLVPELSGTVLPQNFRFISTPLHFAYLKISEGCNRQCTFCAIPLIRGKQRSRAMNALLSEANFLADQGVKELILVSQDTSSYGLDLYGEQRIIQLLEELARLDRFNWIRVLYWYPTNFPHQYIELINRYSSIIPYMDIPFQHCSDRILKKMKRGLSYDNIVDLIERIRSAVPDVVLRTTCISGFPGETDEDFQLMNEFLTKIRFDRMGVFVYSDEDGTEAYSYGAKVTKLIAEKRMESLMETQRIISEENNQQLIGSLQQVLIDRYDEAMRCYLGRTYRDAPEIDNEVCITSPGFQKEIVGSFQTVAINSCTEYDLYGTIRK